MSENGAPGHFFDCAAIEGLARCASSFGGIFWGTRRLERFTMNPQAFASILAPWGSLRRF